MRVPSWSPSQLDKMSGAQMALTRTNTITPKGGKTLGAFSAFYFVTSLDASRSKTTRSSSADSLCLRTVSHVRVFSSDAVNAAATLRGAAIAFLLAL